MFQFKKKLHISETLTAEIRTHSVDTEKETLAIRCETVFVRINEYDEAIKINDNVRQNFPTRCGGT